MIKKGTVHIFEEHEQKLCRDIMAAKGDEKVALIKQLIDLKLDKESIIISWLKRIECYSIYHKLKNA